jgi:hypothetical protein
MLKRTELHTWSLQLATGQPQSLWNGSRLVERGATLTQVKAKPPYIGARAEVYVVQGGSAFSPVYLYGPETSDKEERQDLNTGSSLLGGSTPAPLSVGAGCFLLSEVAGIYTVKLRAIVELDE